MGEINETFVVINAMSCKTCPYRFIKHHIFGDTYHCIPEASHMDVTHNGGKSKFCPVDALYSYKDFKDC